MQIKNEDKTLLILDIDETLVFATDEQLEREADFTIDKYFVYKRPYLNQFLKSVNKHFLLAVWSSASDDYVEEMVKQIIPENINLEFVYGRSKCSYRRNRNRDEIRYVRDNYSNHYNYVKPLRKLKKKGYKIERILIVDDTPHKSQDNFGNAIYPTEYNGALDDDELKYLINYLNYYTLFKALFHRSTFHKGTSCSMLRVNSIKSKTE